MANSYWKLFRELDKIHIRPFHSQWKRIIELDNNKRIIVASFWILETSLSYDNNKRIIVAISLWILETSLR